MDMIAITPEQLEIMIQKAISNALNLRSTTQILPDRCTFKEALKITGLSKSALYKRTMNETIPFKTFGNRLIFSRRELQSWLEVNTLSTPKKKVKVKKSYSS